MKREHRKNCSVALLLLLMTCVLVPMMYARTLNSRNVSTSSLDRINAAALENGGIATASSTTDDEKYPTSSMIDGDRAGAGWSAGGGWAAGIELGIIGGGGAAADAAAAARAARILEMANEANAMGRAAEACGDLERAASEFKHANELWEMYWDLL